MLDETVHELKNLSATRMDELLPVFHDAFADYAVDMNLGATAFREMLTIRGYQATHSMGCFVAGQLKGFILVATRSSGGQLCAYNLTTAVARSYQGQGCADALLAAVMTHLKSLGVVGFMLEVLHDNHRAIKLYRKHGFNTARQLCCYQLPGTALAARNNEAKHSSPPAAVLPWLSDQRFHCFEPSWQNALASYLNLPGAFHVVLQKRAGSVVAWGLVHKHSGQLLQLGMLPAYRTVDTVKRLVSDLAVLTTASQLSCLNVESTCALPELLLQVGFQSTVTQYEMIKTLA